MTDQETKALAAGAYDLESLTPIQVNDEWPRCFQGSWQSPESIARLISHFQSWGRDWQRGVGRLQGWRSYPIQIHVAESNGLQSLTVAVDPSADRLGDWLLNSIR